MTKKMTTAIARKYVERIESLNGQIGDVHAEIAQEYSSGDLNVIGDAIEARAKMREAEFSACGLLESFDATNIN